MAVDRRCRITVLLWAGEAAASASLSSPTRAPGSLLISLGLSLGRSLSLSSLLQRIRVLRALLLRSSLL